jgi:hypothetical protein
MSGGKHHDDEILASDHAQRDYKRHEHHDQAEHHDHIDDEDAPLDDDEKNLLTTVAAVGVVGVGVAVFEAALLPGLALGVAAMAAPKLMPRLGSALNPLFKSTVRGVYKIGQKTKEMVAETQEQVQDIVAEVDSEAKSAGDGAHVAPKA